MAETRTSVKDVIPDVGGRFNLDENVAKCKVLCLVIRGAHTLLSLPFELKNHRMYQLRDRSLDQSVPYSHRKRRRESEVLFSQGMPRLPIYFLSWLTERVHSAQLKRWGKK